MKICNILKTVATAMLLSATPLLAVGADGAAGTNELALPAVPDSLRTPAERADYILLHFWDAMDWSDTTAVNDARWMEQTFVNFASLIPYASSPAALEEAFGRLFDAAKYNTDAYKLILNLADRYFYEPESPMFDEEAYITVLDVVLAYNCIDDTLLSLSILHI